MASVHKFENGADMIAFAVSEHIVAQLILGSRDPLVDSLGAIRQAQLETRRPVRDRRRQTKITSSFA